MNKDFIWKTTLAFVLITYANGIISSKLLNDKNLEIHSLTEQNEKLRSDLAKYETEGMNVTVTMYQPVSYQTDSTPNIL